MQDIKKRFSEDKGEMLIEQVLVIIVLICTLGAVIVMSLVNQTTSLEIEKEFDTFVAEIEAKGKYSSVDKIELQKRLDSVTSSGVVTVDIEKDIGNQVVSFHVNHQERNLRGGIIRNKNFFNTAKNIDFD